MVKIDTAKFFTKKQLFTVNANDIRLQSRVTSSGITVNSQMFLFFVVFFFGFFLLLLFSLLLFLFCIVVFSYLVCLFYFIIILFYFTFGLFVSWFPYMYLMSSLFLQLFQLFFLIATSGREGFVFSSFCLICFVYFLLFFSRGKGYFNSLVSRVRDSSSAGQRMTYVSVFGAYNNFMGGWVD